jgi:hypothetical protein
VRRSRYDAALRAQGLHVHATHAFAAVVGAPWVRGQLAVARSHLTATVHTGVASALRRWYVCCLPLTLVAAALG